MADPEVAYAIPAFEPARVTDLVFEKTHRAIDFSAKAAVPVQFIGPWKSKSDADLSVAFALPQYILQRFATSEPSEIARLPADIRGMRVYQLENVKPGKIGGTEYHRIRKEFLMVPKGSLTLDCEDVYGDVLTQVLRSGEGAYIPPFVKHTYTMREPGSIMVACNTLFGDVDPNDKEREQANQIFRDTYSEDSFRMLQAHYRKA